MHYHCHKNTFQITIINERIISQFSIGRLPDYTLCQDTDDTTCTSHGHQPSLSTSTAIELQDLDEDVWCYCRKGEEGEMIACDSGHCLIGWFHTACLKMTTIPHGNWVCPDCSD